MGPIKTGLISRLLANVALCSLIACGTDVPELPSGVDPARTPTGVVGKSLVDLPGGPAVADELLVSFRPGASDDQRRAAVARAGGEILATGPRTGVHVVRIGGSDPRPAVSSLRGHPDVAWARPSYVAEGAGISTSPGPVELQWNLHALKLDPDRGWAAAAGVRVAVLDSGAAYEDHTDAIGSYALAPDLAQVPFATGYDFINDDDHPNDDQGHGTHVTGVISASDGIMPMAAGSEVLPVKVLDASNRGTEIALAEGIEFAVDQGAGIINMSLSFAPTFFPSPMLQAAIDRAAEHGVIMVASSGNHGAELVAYPAAFREVIAVGSSQLTADFNGKTWNSSHAKLAATDYSNTGYALDLIAPAGRIDEDHDGDGNPEAILAQSFEGDPTSFDYYFYAGTSQAAAQISGLAAVMRAENPNASISDLRALLGETARPGDGPGALDVATGRGYARADLSMRQADAGRASKPRARYFAAVVVAIAETGGERVARATVEIADIEGRPVKDARVYGTFTGNTLASVTAVTDADGLVTLTSPSLTDDAIVAGFQVDAVAKGSVVDRPRGFVRIDSCSLDLISEFAVASGISTSPGPITIRYDGLGPDDVPTLSLLSYAWNGAVAPMAVAVDEAWYRSEFAGSEPLSVQAFGFGISTSPLVIDPQQSFHGSVTQSWQPQASSSDCVPLVLRTFSSGPIDMSFSPVVTDPLTCAGSCDPIEDTLLEMWQAWGMGISTSPVWDPSGGLDQALFSHLSQMLQRYVSFGGSATGFPLAALGGVLDAAGIGLTPLAGITSNSGTGMEVMSQ